MDVWLTQAAGEIEILLGAPETLASIKRERLTSQRAVSARMKRLRKADLDSAENVVLRERAQHGTIEKAYVQIKDVRGAIGAPLKVVNTLEQMRRKGTITGAMSEAGRIFRDDFDGAALEALRAANLARIGAGKGNDPTIAQIAARERVWRAIVRLGGLASPGGACAWHVLGLEESVAAWAQREGWHGRPLNQHTAAGILIGTLGMLADYYRC